MSKTIFFSLVLRELEEKKPKYFVPVSPQKMHLKLSSSSWFSWWSTFSLPKLSLFSFTFWLLLSIFWPLSKASLFCAASWTAFLICFFPARVRNIWSFSPLVPSKREKNILVLLKVLLSMYTFRGKCVYFSIFMIKHPSKNIQTEQN